MKKYYAIGLDFGTLSARGILVDVATGEVGATAVYKFRDAVIDSYLPGTEIKLPPAYALQNPQDYLDALVYILSEINKQAPDKAECVVGISAGFTSCTMLPVDEHYMPLCFLDRFKDRIHSWPKLWKHHGAQYEADVINETALRRSEPFIKRYGNKSSSQWMIAKILETLNHDPEVYHNAYRFIEGGDWIVYLLTGQDVRSSCLAGYKCFWSKQDGYPSKAFFKALDPRMETVIEDKLGYDVHPIGGKAGGLTMEMAEKTGLSPGIAVGVGNTDAHLCVPGIGITKPGDLALIMGTSLCHMILDEKEVLPNGICGVVEDGIIPGFFGYEMGQPAAGDLFDWFARNLAPEAYMREAMERNISVFEVMDEKAAKLIPGESGLVALDWWDGNRSLLVNMDLSGLIAGFSLRTKPEEIYLALIEAAAFGTRLIVDHYIGNGIAVNRVFACGGLVKSSRTVMQVFANVLERDILIAPQEQTSALGAAMYGAVAAGEKAGGHDTIQSASAAMASRQYETVHTNKEYHSVYTALYKTYLLLHDFFGKERPDLMKTLRRIKAESTSGR